MGDALVAGSVGPADFYPKVVEPHQYSIYDKSKKFEDEPAIHHAPFDPHHWLFEGTPTALGEKRRTYKALNQKIKPRSIAI